MTQRSLCLFEQPVPELQNAASGIGLRASHFQDILAQKPPVGFLEAHSENFFRIGGAPFESLVACRAIYPISLHGVGLSLGSAGGVDQDHLQKLKTLVDIIEPALVSEHVSWSTADGKAVPDLLPLPFTQEALDTICTNIDLVQNTLGRSILVENPSSYLNWESMMQEPEFLAEIIKRTGCGLLLDVNNIEVSAYNLTFDPFAYIEALPRGIIGEIHLAGYQDNGEIYVDAHNHPVHDRVWQLYEAALARFGDMPTLMEWDNDLPALNVLVSEAAKADARRKIYKRSRHASAA